MHKVTQWLLNPKSIFLFIYFPCNAYMKSLFCYENPRSCVIKEFRVCVSGASLPPHMFMLIYLFFFFWIIFLERKRLPYIPISKDTKILRNCFQLQWHFFFFRSESPQPVEQSQNVQLQVSEVKLPALLGQTDRWIDRLGRNQLSWSWNIYGIADSRIWKFVMF